MSNENSFEIWQVAFFSRLNRRFETASAEDILAWAIADFGPGLSIGTAFGASGMVLMDLALRLDPDVDIFYVDTGYFFPQTLELIERAQRYYGRSFRQVTPKQTVEEQARSHGLDLYSRDPDLCCQLRKVAPMEKALLDSTAWVTALRRDQSSTRGNTPIVRWNARHGVAKIAPLARWTEDDLWRYIHAHNVPYNDLHDQNYPSIGCWPCTRSVDPGESDLRAGRWVGMAKTECGLHWAQEKAV
jgi:phosphoadenosine phosphosulfate reductase